ncbi:MAG: alkane 1-monooxygenase [Acidobacteriota bacterium]
MAVWKYYSVLLFVPFTLWAFYRGGYWSFNLPVIVFGLIPLIELMSTGRKENPTARQEAEMSRAAAYDWVLYLVVPAQYGQLAYFLHRVSSGSLDTLGLIGATCTMGICCGVLGINVAHELGHRHRPGERFLAKSLLLTSLYLHFFIEHNRGHHTRIATPDDPASARYGESLFAFWLRSVAGSYGDAWKLEKRRLARRRRGWFSLQNQMLRFQVVQLGFVGCIYYMFGGAATLHFVAAAIMGFLLLETVNYIEHYGLSRGRLENGRWERVSQVHCWNSSYSLGRLLLFELTRHSDHHLHASRKYQILRHWEESPQMPTGYPGMMVLALCPPLWFRIMHRQMESLPSPSAGRPPSRGGAVPSKGDLPDPSGGLCPR